MAHQLDLQSFAEAQHRLRRLTRQRVISYGQAAIVRVTESGDWVPQPEAIAPIEAALDPRTSSLGAKP
jgi:hypothetical protein